MSGRPGSERPAQQPTSSPSGHDYDSTEDAPGSPDPDYPQLHQQSRRVRPYVPRISHQDLRGAPPGGKSSY